MSVFLYVFLFGIGVSERGSTDPDQISHTLERIGFFYYVGSVNIHLIVGLMSEMKNEDDCYAFQVENIHNHLPTANTQ